MPDRPAPPAPGEVSGVEAPGIDDRTIDDAIAPVPSEATGSANLAARLRDLEGQLDALSHELRSPGGGRSLSEVGGATSGSRWERRLDDLAQRIHGLAGEQKRLRSHFSQLLDRFEALSADSAPNSGGPSPEPIASTPGVSTPGVSTPGDLAELDGRPLPQRLLSFGKALARRLRPAHPQRLVILEPVVGPAAERTPTLGVVLSPPDALAGEGDISRIFGSQTQPPDAVLRNAPSGGLDLEAGAKPPDLVLRPEDSPGSLHPGEPGSRPLPRGLCELLRLLFASEDLDFAEIALGGGQRWRCERPGGPRGRQLGKVLTWDGDATSAIPLSTHDRLGVGTYRHLGTVLPRRHVLRPLDSIAPRPAPGFSDRSTQDGLWLRLRSLLGGGDQLVATLARVTDRPLRVVLDEPSDPLGAERRRRLERRFPALAILPVADVLATPLRTSAHRPIAMRQGVRRSIDVAPWAPHAPHLVPSEPSDLGLPPLPLPVEPQSGWPWWVAGAGHGERASSNGRRLRQWLGVPDDHLLIAHTGDLVPQHRPEDFVSLARHLVDLPRCHFLMVGRGPLAGPVDDLARYAAHPRFRRLDSLDEGELWAAADVACSMAPQGADLPGLISALAAGRPVVARDKGLDALVDGAAGLVPEGGAATGGVAKVADAIRRLADAPDRLAELAQGARAFAGPFAPSRAEVAWRRIFDSLSQD